MNNCDHVGWNPYSILLGTSEFEPNINAKINSTRWSWALQVRWDWEIMNHSATDEMMGDSGSRCAGSSSSESSRWVQTSGRSWRVNDQSSAKAQRLYLGTTSYYFHYWKWRIQVAVQSMPTNENASAQWNGGMESTRYPHWERRAAIGKRDRLACLISHRMPVNHSDEHDFATSIHTWMTAFYKSWSTRQSLEYLRGQMFTSSS